MRSGYGLKPHIGKDATAESEKGPDESVIHRQPPDSVISAVAVRLGGPLRSRYERQGGVKGERLAKTVFVQKIWRNPCALLLYCLGLPFIPSKFVVEQNLVSSTGGSLSTAGG